MAGTLPRLGAAVATVAATAAALLVSAAPAQAQTCSRYASTSGSDSAAGTEQQPYRSVQKLVQSLSSGETGCLRAGTYSGEVRIATAGITLRSYPGERVTVTGGQFKVFADRVTVEELYLHNTNGKNSPTVNASDVVLRNNDISNHHTGICMILGNSHGDYPRAVRTRVENNRIHDCGVLPATNQDHGIYVDGADDTRITGNWIYDNADRGVQLFPDARHTLVAGNVIDGNGTGVTFSGAYGLGSRYNRVEGNVLANAATQYNAQSWWESGTPVGVGNVLTANCTFRSARTDHGPAGINTESGGFASTNNVTAEPSYRDRAGKDFRLGAGTCADVYTGPNEVPGPGGTRAGLRPRKRPLLTLSVRPRVIRSGRKALVVGRADTSRIRPGRRVAIYAKLGRRSRRIATGRVGATGRFRVRVRVRTSKRRLRLVAVARGAGHSQSVGVRVRRR